MPSLVKDLEDLPIQLENHGIEYRKDLKKFLQTIHPDHNEEQVDSKVREMEKSLIEDLIDPRILECIKDRKTIDPESLIMLASMTLGQLHLYSYQETVKNKATERDDSELIWSMNFAISSKKIWFRKIISILNARFQDIESGDVEEKEIFKIVDANKRYLTTGWKAANDALTKSKKEDLKKGGGNKQTNVPRGGSSARGGRGGNASRPSTNQAIKLATGSKASDKTVN
jgi:hypothetical protein